MENNLLEFDNYFVVIILIIAAIAFIGGVVWGGIYSFKETSKPFDSTVSGFIVGVAGIMTTNLGVVLGIKIDQGESLLATFGDSTQSKLHFYTAIGYFCILFLVGVAWIVWRFIKEPEWHLAPFIPLFGETFLGVLLAVLGANFT